MSVFACAEVNGHKIEAKVMNPGSYDHVWLVEIGGFVFPQYYAIEGDTFEQAMDEFADSEAGHHIHCEEPAFGDYKIPVDGEEKEWMNLRGEKLTPEQAKSLSEPVYLGNGGTPCDLDWFSMSEFKGCVYFDKDDTDCQNIPPSLYPNRELRFKVVDEDEHFIKGNFRTERDAHDWVKAQDFHEPLYIEEQENLDTVADEGGEG